MAPLQDEQLYITDPLALQYVVMKEYHKFTQDPIIMTCVFSPVRLISLDVTLPLPVLPGPYLDQTSHLWSVRRNMPYILA